MEDNYYKPFEIYTIANRYWVVQYFNYTGAMRVIYVDSAEVVDELGAFTQAIRKLGALQRRAARRRSKRNV